MEENIRKPTQEIAMNMNNKIGNSSVKKIW